MDRRSLRTGVFLPDSVGLALRMERIPVRRVAQRAGYSLVHTHEVLVGRRRASVRFLEALADLGVLARAEARAQAFLAALNDHR